MKQQRPETQINISLSTKIGLFILALFICFQFSLVIYKHVATDKLRARENTLEQLYQEEFIMPPTAKLKKTTFKMPKGYSIYVKKEYETDDDPMTWYDYFHEQGEKKGWRLTDDRLYDDGYKIEWYVLNDQYIVYIDVKKRKKKQEYEIRSGAAINDFWKRNHLG